MLLLGLEVAACNQDKGNRTGSLPGSEKTEWDKQKRWERDRKGSRRPTNTQHAHTHTKEYHWRDGAQASACLSESMGRSANVHEPVWVGKPARGCRVAGEGKMNSKTQHAYTHTKGHQWRRRRLARARWSTWVDP
eukprot:1102114-Pleurochrysis_carterae.AAC.2